MHRLGIETGADLRAWSLPELRELFGKSAQYYFDIARGIDNRRVQNSRQRRSIGSESTFQVDLTQTVDMLDQLEQLAVQVADVLLSKSLVARTLTIKVKYADFRLVTRSHSLLTHIRSADDMFSWLPFLLGKTDADSKPVRLLGVSVSGLVPASVREMVQLPLL